MKLLIRLFGNEIGQELLERIVKKSLRLMGIGFCHKVVT